MSSCDCTSNIVIINVATVYDMSFMIWRCEVHIWTHWCLTCFMQYLYLLWIPITLPEVQQKFHNTLCALRPLLLHYHISTVQNPYVRVCVVHMLSCVCVHVSVPMFVLLHSPRCSIRCIFSCFLNLILLLLQLLDVE